MWKSEKTLCDKSRVVNALRGELDKVSSSTFSCQWTKFGVEIRRACRAHNHVKGEVRMIIKAGFQAEQIQFLANVTKA